MASRPQSLLTPPRAPRAAPPNTATPNGLPRRRQVGHRLLDLGLPGGAAPPPEGGFPTPFQGGIHASTAPPPWPPTAEALTALTDVPRAVHPLLDLGSRGGGGAAAPLEGCFPTPALGGVHASLAPLPRPPTTAALTVPPRTGVQTYVAPERPDVAALRPSTAALAQACAVSLDPYASAATVRVAHGTHVAQRLLDQSQSLPSLAEWRSSPELRRFFWLCSRCSVTNGNDATCCRGCNDGRDAILQTTSVDEASALVANTHHTAYGRSLVRCARVAPPPCGLALAACPCPRPACARPTRPRTLHTDLLPPLLRHALLCIRSSAARMQIPCMQPRAMQVCLAGRAPIVREGVAPEIGDPTYRAAVNEAPHFLSVP